MPTRPDGWWNASRDQVMNTFHSPGATGGGAVDTGYRYRVEIAPEDLTTQRVNSSTPNDRDGCQRGHTPPQTFADGASTRRYSDQCDQSKKQSLPGHSSLQAPYLSGKYSTQDIHARQQLRGDVYDATLQESRGRVKAHKIASFPSDEAQASDSSHGRVAQTQVKRSIDVVGPCQSRGSSQNTSCNV